MLRISFFLCLLVMAIRTQEDDDKLLLTVLYESKCPDSREFIVEELVPTMDLLQEYVSLYLVPFGKARSINGSNIRFECQHGPRECMGNMFQGCVLDLMQGRASDFRMAKYVACEMETEAGTVQNVTCAKRAGANVGMVTDCMSSSQGTHLQLRYERETKRFRPRFIPTVTINNKFNQKIQDMAIKNLGLTLCTRFLRRAAPCTRRFGKMMDQDFD